MKFVQTLLALALVGSMGSVSAVGPGVLGNLSGTSYSIGNSFGAGASILDTYTFDITPLSSVAGTAVSIELDISELSGEEFSISNFRIEFRDASHALIAWDVASGPADYTLNLSELLPAASGYKFIVSGDVTGTLGGSYGGALAAAPIPEAESYAMMLAGLGLVGFMVSRRRRVL